MPGFTDVWADASIIKGYFSRAEAEALHKEACTVPHDQMIVEVGCLCGRSTTVLASAGRTLWTIGPMELGTSDGFNNISQEDVDTLQENLLPYPNVYWKRCTVDDIQEPPETVGLVFIDGDHWGGHPLHDYEVLERYLDAGARVAFHDYGNAPEVKQTVKGLIKTGRLRRIRYVDKMMICARCGTGSTQRGEDKIIREFFGDEKGRFLDVGAWDGVDKSNVRFLAEDGWGGVLVEPAVRPFLKMARNYAGFEDVQLVHAAIMQSAGISRWWDTEDALSTFSARHMRQWAEGAGVPFQEMWIAHVTFPDLFRALPGPYDFVSIDAEGHSVSLLQSFDPVLVSARLVCVEHDDRHPDIDEWAKTYGYRRVSATTENVFLGKE